jgi:ribosomal protein L11 methyltransferase
MTRPLWVVALEVPKAAGDRVADALTGLSESCSWFETGRGTLWRFEALLGAEPDRAALESLLAETLRAASLSLPEVMIARLPDKDWLAENRKQFPPVSAGRFFVYGSFFEGRVPPGRVAVELDVGLAFGAGTHESTRGCLLALDRLARRRRFRRPLDLGCGSGILAIAMARLWRVPVETADIDPVAVAVARDNARRNRLARLVRPVVSRGLRTKRLRRAAPYDLIVANILARPLERLAPTLARAGTRAGTLVLSGILAVQTPGVIAAYRAQGRALKGRIRLGSWETLVLGKAGPRR